MNMSYCRFGNTLGDLRDCEENFDSIHSEEELRAARKLVKVCQSIALLDPDKLALAPKEDDE